MWNKRRGVIFRPCSSPSCGICGPAYPRQCAAFSCRDHTCCCCCCRGGAEDQNAAIRESNSWVFMEGRERGKGERNVLDPKQTFVQCIRRIANVTAGDTRTAPHTKHVAPCSSTVCVHPRFRHCCWRLCCYCFRRRSRCHCYLRYLAACPLVRRRKRNCSFRSSGLTQHEDPGNED